MDDLVKKGELSDADRIKVLDELENVAEIKTGANISELIGKYGKLVRKGDESLKVAYKNGYRKFLSEVHTPELSKKFGDDFLKKIPKPKNKLTYLKRRRTIYLNNKKGTFFEELFQKTYGGIKPKGAMGKPPRYVDNILDNVAKELKSGYIKNSKSFKEQIKKDIEILLQPQKFEINKYEWHILDGIDDNALKFIQDQAKKNGVLDKIEIIIY